MADVKPVLCPSPGFYIVAAITTRTWEANRRRKKEKLPGVADSSKSDGNKTLDSPSGMSKDHSLLKRAGLLPQDTSTTLSATTLGVSAGKKPGNPWMIGPPSGFF